MDGTQIIDLDQFIDAKTNTVQPAQTRGLKMPDADRIVVVGIFADDSWSMVPLREAVIEGLNLSVEAFEGAKGSDFYLDVRGFGKTYYHGALKDIDRRVLQEYRPEGGTPLIQYALPHLKDLKSVAEQYRGMGIPTTVAMLVMTDGFPDDEEVSPEMFARQIGQNDYVVGMGISERGNDRGIGAYSALFRRMGINKIMTPGASPSEVRHAINMFSLSVASISP
jgi:hypothetical protein